MKENNLPETVAAYLAAMNDIMSSDKQMKSEILDNDLIDKKMYWQLFETAAMNNYVNNEGDPSLTANQFKEVMITCMNISMEGRLQKMVSDGLIEEGDGGFKITDDGIKAYKRAQENK